MGVILTCALMGHFVKEEQFGERICSSTFDGLVTGFVDDAVQFAFEVLSIIEHLLLLSFVIGVVNGHHPVGVDAGGQVLMNEGPDAPLEALGLECLW